MSRPLDGVRVIEIAHQSVAIAGKLLAGLGADVVLVEPHGGTPARRVGPFAESGASVSWAVNNIDKRSVVLDLTDAHDRESFDALLATAAVVLDGLETVDMLGLGLDREAVLVARPDLVWTTVTPFGVRNPRTGEPATDLTLAAGGGLVWSCGYDDHRLPPVRPGGDQTLQTGAMWATIGTLTALLHREASGKGQFVDVSVLAAMNITTEQASYEWLVAKTTVQRQTGRHAAVQPTQSPYAVGSDGRLIHTGVPPRSQKEYQTLLRWLRETGLDADFGDIVFLEMGAEHGIDYDAIGTDPVATEIYGAGRDAMLMLAERQPGYEYFVGAQTRGLSAGLVYEPGEVLDDPHLVAREFAVTIDDPAIGSLRTPGPPFRSAGAVDPRPAPAVGQHNDELLR